MSGASLPLRRKGATAMDLHTTRRAGSWLKLAVVLAALVLSACGSQRTAQTRPTLTATLLALPTPITGLLDPIPPACQPTEPPRTQQLDLLDGFSGGVQLMGDGPAWISSDLEVLHLNQLVGYHPLPNTKMLWVVGPDTFPVITI
jgi:hypothetical protein